MMLIEINEFSPSLMGQAADILDAKNLKRLLAMTHTETTTDDLHERYGLDPWVQWVSIHTGKASKDHNIRHLGDIPHLDQPQVWETLSAMGFSTGIWGAMNASRGSAKKCKFFPDPWSFTENAHPPVLNKLLGFPRYFSKNYGDLNKLEVLKELFKLISFCVNPKIFKALLPIMPLFVKSILKNGFHEYLLFVLFDLVNSILFVEYYKKYKPDFSIIFLNSLAHLQHHKWTSKDSLSDEMKTAFSIFDCALGVLLSHVPQDQPIVIANAFRQYQSYDKNEFLYRQKNPDLFLKAVGVTFKNVEQAMTNDGHVFFESNADARIAASVLKNATVNGDLLFHVEHDLSHPNKIFFQILLWKDLPSDSVLEINGKKVHFFDLFDRVAQRSGMHMPDGDIYSQGIFFPNLIHNHLIHDYVLSYFASRPLKLV